MSARAHLLPAVARFLEHEGHRAPDFTACLVLVPHHHAAQDFRRALRHALPHPVLLPPRLLTLPELAQDVSDGDDVDPESRRLAELHELLRRTGHVPEASLWQAAQSLLALLEELDTCDTDLDDAAHRQTLGLHAHNRHLSLEAGIAHAVWQAFRQTRPGKSRAYARRLVTLAADARQPLYHVGLAALGRHEEAFLRGWQARQPVFALPAPAPHPQRQALFDALLAADGPPLAQRSCEFAARAGDSPLAGSLDIDAAPGLEQAARAAERILLDWLAAGRRDIALVAFDRLLARRLRALLERRGILVQDETGWAFSTSAVSHVLDRWLSLAGGRIWHKDLIDLMKSPFMFGDAVETRQRAAHQIETALRRHGAPANLEGYLALARQEGLDEALPLLRRLASARAAFPRRHLGLAAWTRNLLDSLDTLGALGALAVDPIGAQLIELLTRLEHECGELPQRFSLADWRRWLFLHLEQGTFIDTSVESPIRLTHLAAAHHRELDAAMLLGVGAAHLPGGRPGGLFNASTLRQLGLSDPASKEEKERRLLADLLCRVPVASLIWQSESDGDPAPLSPWLLHLDAFHQAAWGRSLVRQAAPRHAQARATPASAPDAPVRALPPQRLSVSAWQSLVACPYQFFARHILGLNEQDEAPEEMDKAEYGSIVHRILARFHATHPTLLDADAATWAARLVTLTQDAFAPFEAHNYQAVAWRLRWTRHIPDYIAWAMAHEAAGWRFQSAETPLEKAVAWSETASTSLYGRADRIDAGREGLAVLDYKTQSRTTLRHKLDTSGEDVQLAAYAWLTGADLSGFVTLDDAKVALLRTEGDTPLADVAQAEAQRVAATLGAMAAGHPLPAHGAPATCAWCEMEGLCRRAHRDALRA